VTRYRATIAYVGTAFHGWQRQTNAPRTVQAVLERALGRLAHGRVRAEAAGRTDAGVHADGQVAHFDLPRPLPPRVVRDAVNAELPPDVRVLDVALAPDGFHARFDARWKEYLYRWSRAEVIPPRDAPFVAPISPRAEAERMREAASALPGRRDFSVFAVRRLSARGESGVRTLESLRIDEEGDEIRALFRGEGFLRGMVRSIAGVLADAARGKAPVSRAEELLRSGDRQRLSPKAPAKGLTLLRVGYGPETP
jgi:tRNA pseudouridine38-40 synthase